MQKRKHVFVVSHKITAHHPTNKKVVSIAKISWFLFSNQQRLCFSIAKFGYKSLYLIWFEEYWVTMWNGRAKGFKTYQLDEQPSQFSVHLSFSQLSVLSSNTRITKRLFLAISCVRAMHFAIYFVIKPMCQITVALTLPKQKMALKQKYLTMGRLHVAQLEKR